MNEEFRHNAAIPRSIVQGAAELGNELYGLELQKKSKIGVENFHAQSDLEIVWGKLNVLQILAKREDDLHDGGRARFAVLRLQRLVFALNWFLGYIPGHRDMPKTAIGPAFVAADEVINCTAATSIALVFLPHLEAAVENMVTTALKSLDSHLNKSTKLFPFFSDGLFKWNAGKNGYSINLVLDSPLVLDRERYGSHLKKSTKMFLFSSDGLSKWNAGKNGYLSLTYPENVTLEGPQNNFCGSWQSQVRQPVSFKNIKLPLTYPNMVAQEPYVNDRKVWEPSDESEKELNPTSHLIEPTLTHPQGTLNTFSIRRHGFIQSISLILAVIDRFWRVKTRPRVAKGYRRLEWKCECGDNLWADFDDSNPELVDELEYELRQRRASGSITNESNIVPVSQEPILDPTRKSTDIISSGRTGQMWLPGPSVQHSHVKTAASSSSDGMNNLIPLSQISHSSGDPMQNNATPGDSLPSSGEHNAQTSGGNSMRCRFNASLVAPTYVETCVKSKSHVSRHKEVQVKMCEDDYHFFKRVKDAYLELRGSRWLNLLKPFSVQKMGEVVGIFDHDKPVYPPQEEVQNGSYHYDPCPCLGVPSNIILHELNSPKSQLHTSQIWSTRLAKKTRCSIFSTSHPGDAAIGYGIHIIEGYTINGFVLGILGMFGVLIAGVATGLWWARGSPGDIQGATGLGSLVLGIVGALILSCQAMFS
ncbi:hypothetical protein ACMFMG_003203 [Clarireedia jacksonii]